MGHRSHALSLPANALAIERPDLRTRTARVWQLARHRFYCVVRMSTHCYGDGYENVIDYRLVNGRPAASPFGVLLSRAGEHIRIGGLDARLVDFGTLSHGRWQPMLAVEPRKLTVTPRCAPYRYDPTWHASYLDGELAPGVQFHAAISAKGYGKELRFARAVQTHWFRKLDGAEFFGLRYKRDGQLTGWHMQPPRMFVRNRGGQAQGFYREDGEYLYALWPRSQIDRLLPGEWIVDPAITQESVVANSDDCYEDGGASNNLDGYAGRDYAGAAFGNFYNAGLRFQSIPIPADATGMNSATLQVFREGFGGAPSITIFADADDNAGTWAAGTGAERPNGSGVVRTTASTNWNSAFGSNGTYVTTPSIAAVVDEVIQRAGWAENNAIRFPVIAITTTGTNFITWNDFSNNSTTEEALFDADYIAAGGGGVVNTEVLSDALVVGDQALRYWFANRRIEDAVTVTDEALATVVGNAILTRMLESTLVVSDGVVASSIRNQILQDTIIVSEPALQTFINTNLIATDELTIFDESFRHILYRRLMGDDVSITDEAIATLIGQNLISRVLTSEITTYDEAFLWLSRYRLGESNVLTADEAQRVVSYTRNLLSLIDAIDSAESQMHRFILLTDALSVNDSFSSMVSTPTTDSPLIRIGFDQPRIDIGGYSLN